MKNETHPRIKVVWHRTLENQVRSDKIQRLRKSHFKMITKTYRTHYRAQQLRGSSWYRCRQIVSHPLKCFQNGLKLPYKTVNMTMHQHI